MKKSGIFFALATAFALTSCNGFIYEDQGDCDPHYKARFRFERNMKETDAFASQVKAVTLYLVDNETGKIVWQKAESGENVRSDGYLMDLPVDPGKYHLVAWCGEGVGPDFHVNVTDNHQDLNCHLVHNSFSRGDDGAYHVDRHLNDLYHGRLMEQHFPNEEGTHVYTVDLTKNTNEVNIVLQQLSGGPIDASKFSIYITDANHVLDWKNDINVAESESIVYHPHTVNGGVAGIETPDNQVTPLSALVAEMTVSRLVVGQENYICVVNNETGEIVFKVPLIQYALLVKGYEGRKYSDQEYLDRQDKYDMVFFLDEGYRWIDSYIYINSWKIVLQNSGL